jgi:hypothetical protein
MKIVVLDGYTLNPGDLSWEGLEKLGEVTVYDRTPADKVVSGRRMPKLSSRTKRHWVRIF